MTHYKDMSFYSCKEVAFEALKIMLFYYILSTSFGLHAARAMYLQLRFLSHGLKKSLKFWQIA